MLLSVYTALLSSHLFTHCPPSVLLFRPPLYVSAHRCCDLIAEGCIRQVLNNYCTSLLVTSQYHPLHSYLPTSLSASPHLSSLLLNHLPSSGHLFLDRHTSVHAGEQSFKLAVLIDKVNTLFPVKIALFTSSISISVLGGKIAWLRV